MTHWPQKRLKHLAQVRPSNVDKKTVEGERPVLLCNYVDVYKNDSITPDMNFMAATATEEQCRAFELRADDVLVTKDSEDWRDIAVPAHVVTDLPGVVCGYHLAMIRPDRSQCLGRYLFYAFQAGGVADQFRMSANGITRYGLAVDDLATALFPVPPLPAQRAITTFLDRKTAEIDAVVAAKERMIGLLQEQRYALISRAVTRGLNPTVPAKDWGYGWLGPVPAHWAVERLKFSLSLIEQGWSPQCDNRLADEDEWGVLKVGCVNGNEFDPTEQKALPAGVEPETRYEIKPGDILMSRGNTRELVGSAALVREVRPRLLLCDLLYRLRVRPDRADAEYIVHQLRSRSVRIQIEREASGTSNSMKKIGQETISEFVICLPPLAEQHRIVAHIRQETARIDGIVRTITEQVARLREYRQTLISAAVTGKLVVPPVDSADFPATVLAAEIVHRLHGTKHFGRTKLHKLVYAAHHHCRLTVIDADYARLAFGPYDEPLQMRIEAELRERHWYMPSPGERVTYAPLERAGEHRPHFDRLYGDRASAVHDLIERFRDLNKNQTERAMTLYAAWNDFLIRGEPVDDRRLLAEVQHNWHPEKQHSEESWRASLDWLKAQHLIPHGFGKPTRPTAAGEVAP